MEAKPSWWERLWHWVQACLIILLLLTGFQMHYPDQLIIFKDLGLVFNLHWQLGTAWLINTLLGLFYQITTGKILLFLPERDDLLHRASKQAGYYLSGIFRHQAPPYIEDAHHRFNPLQRIVYFKLLFILIPSQILTGMILFYAPDHWPILFDRLRGFKILSPLHTLLAYFFLSFLIMHLYLSTTTGSWFNQRD